MEKIWDLMKQWLEGMNVPEACLDSIERMSPRERADLPIYHPRHEPMQIRERSEADDPVQRRFSTEGRYGRQHMELCK